MSTILRKGKIVRSTTIGECVICFKQKKTIYKYGKQFISFEKGETVYEFGGCTYECISEGKIAVILQPGDLHFYEIPCEVVEW